MSSASNPCKTQNLSGCELANPPPKSNHAQVALSEITRHPRFWFDDGNLVLLAGTIGFKVYRGLLAAQSPVFQDLFASATHAEEEYGGCPVVRLTDSPQDWSQLLDVLLPMTYVRISDSHRCQYEQISALIRLANKYQLESIERQAVECLKTVFTDAFEEWNSPPQDALKLADPQQVVEVVYLARLTNCSSMLPLACYHCALLGEEVLNSLTSDGELDSEDVRRCVGGYRQLCELKTTIPTRLFGHPPSVSCRSPIMCGELLRRLEEKAALVYETPKLLNSVEQWTLSFPLCGMCQEELDERDRARRRELWQKLPEMFGLVDEVKSWA
ncbi:hypothetical protein BD311DRAFT_733341 [Dichomitus squalens]|uniref:BTB domain-containing protein n=1 Tax=Dichomitus squalens TaxID=114155 RepID=A0A4Q9M5L1_9APHY|nr:hypothetical protein BD311DRAFT_733341 [Dichomitus squalens]